jgi:hypothetical protein
MFVLGFVVGALCLVVLGCAALYWLGSGSAPLPPSLAAQQAIAEIERRTIAELLHTDALGVVVNGTEKEESGV